LKKPKKAAVAAARLVGLIWIGSVGALFIAASLMRMFMSAAGLTTH
jgi:hypothetical protein